MILGSKVTIVELASDSRGYLHPLLHEVHVARAWSSDWTSGLATLASERSYHARDH